MKRLIEPELLDELPPEDARAIRSRADLRRLNCLMRHADIIRANLASRLQNPPRCIAELGAGDGTVLLEVARQMHTRWSGVRVLLVDRQRTVAAATLAKFAELGWPAEAVTADAFDWLAAESNSADAIVANLFLHHFADEKLAELLRLIARRTNLFLACETRRTAPSFAVCHLLWLLGCNAVTRHDAVISMRAGFAGCELSALWPANHERRTEERAVILFTHLFIAQRCS